MAIKKVIDVSHKVNGINHRVEDEDSKYNFKYSGMIKKLKEWTKVNFFFNRGVVYYNEKTPKLKPLDKNLASLIEPELLDYDKSHFDTPLSHLLYITLLVGKVLERTEAEKALKEICDNSVKNVKDD